MRAAPNASVTIECVSGDQSNGGAGVYAMSCIALENINIRGCILGVFVAQSSFTHCSMRCDFTIVSLVECGRGMEVSTPCDVHLSAVSVTNSTNRVSTGGLAISGAHVVLYDIAIKYVYSYELSKKPLPIRHARGLSTGCVAPSVVRAALVLNVFAEANSECVG